MRGPAACGTSIARWDYGRGSTRTCCRIFVTAMLGAGVDLRDVQIAARHADPRTTTRYESGLAPTWTATPTRS